MIHSLVTLGILDHFVGLPVQGSVGLVKPALAGAEELSFGKDRS